MFQSFRGLDRWGLCDGLPKGHHTPTGEPGCIEIDVVNLITGAAILVVNAVVATRAAASDVIDAAAMTVAASDAIDAAVMTVAASTAPNAGKRSVVAESIAVLVGSRSAWMSTVSTI